MALIGAAFALGFTLGPMLGAAALLAGGELTISPWPGYVASGFSGIALLMAIFWLPESRRPGMQAETHKLLDRRALRAALATPTVGLLLLTSFIAVFSFANFETTLSRQVGKLVDEMDAAEKARQRQGAGEAGPNADDDTDAAQPPQPTPYLVEQVAAWARSRGYEELQEIKLIVVLAVFAYLGIVLTLAQGVLVRRLAGKIKEGPLALAGSVLAIIGFLLLAWATNPQAPSFNLLLVAMAIEVIGFALVNPSLQSLISRRSDPDQQGAILGLSQSMSSLSRILGPVFGNILFAFWVVSPYLAATALMALAVALMLPAVRGGKDFA
jgi:hypothetical protein